MNIIPYVNRPAPLAWDVAAAIFGATGEGGIYDPSALDMIFQDANGTTPAVPGSPVGLVLDKRLWGGKTLEEVLAGQPERITNGGFNSDLSSWVVGANISATWVNGEAEVTFAGPIGAAGNWFYATDAFETDDAKRWRVEFDATWVSGGDMEVGAGYTVRRVITPNGGVRTRYAVVVARGASSSDTNKNRLTFAGTAGAVWRLDNVSVKEIPGNHLTQSTTAARPILARMPKTGRRNMLTWTEEFANTAWNTAGATNSNYVLDNTAIAPNGTMTASHVIAAPIEVTSHGRRSSITGLTELTTYRFSFYAKAAEYSVARAWSFPGGVTSLSLFNLLTGETNGNNSAQMLELADGWWRCSLNVVTVGSQTTRVVHFGPSPAFDQLSFTGDGVSGIYVWGAQLELGSTPTAYQRVTNAFDVAEAGVSDVYDLTYDLVDDALTTVLPQAINGDILIAGTKGSIIEPVNYAAGSTFTLGPDTYTGGTPGILSAIGGIVGVLVIDRSLTQVEKDQLIAHYKGKGAKGLLVEGPELVVNPGNPFTVTTGWTTLVSSLSVEDGALRVTKTNTNGQARSSITSSSGGFYKYKATLKGRTTTSSVHFQLGPTAGNITLVNRAVVGSSPPVVSPITVDGVVVSPGSSLHISLYSALDTGQYDDWSEVSIRELRPQEDW